jgi:heat shock protein HtpX
VFWLVAMAAAALGYVLAIVIRMAISRRREYVADAGSVELTKNPDAMISALQKVAGHTHLDAPQSMRAMFLEEEDDGIFGLFATHPPVAKRIAALQHYAGGRIVEHADPAVIPAAPAQIVADTPGPWGAVPAPSPRDGKVGPWG